MADTVRVVAVLQAQEGKGAQLLDSWPALSAQVLAEDGCLSYDLHRVAGDVDQFVVLERWASVEALAVHGVAEHMKAFGMASRDYMAARPQVIVLEDAPSA